MSSVPTTDSATWCRTPAAFSAARRLRVEFSKNSSTGLSSKDGELATSTTTCAPVRAAARPSPVTALTPEEGEAATTSWPSLRRLATTLEPMRPVPPITTIFMTLDWEFVFITNPDEPAFRFVTGSILKPFNHGLRGLNGCGFEPFPYLWNQCNPWSKPLCLCG